MIPLSKLPIQSLDECLSADDAGGHSFHTRSLSNRPPLGSSNSINDGQRDLDHQYRTKKDHKSQIVMAKKCVRFTPLQANQVYYVPSRRDYSEIELETMYLIMGDYRRIRLDNHRTLYAMRKGCLPNNDQEYFRGLERETHQGRLNRDEMVALTILAIREEQAQNHGSIDHEWVKQIYSRLTEKSGELALQAASWDAVQARDVYSDQLT